MRLVELAEKLPGERRVALVPESVARLVAGRYAPGLSEGAPESPESLLSLAAVRDNVLGAEGRRGAYEVRLALLAKRLEARIGGGRPNPARLLLDRCRKLIELLKKAKEQFRLESPHASIPVLLEVHSALQALPPNPWKTQKLNELTEVIISCAGLWLEVSANDFGVVPGQELKVTATALNRSP